MSLAGYLRAVARLAAREFRERGTERPLSRRPIVVERWGLGVTRRDLDGYLRATGGEGLAACAAADPPLPPLFGAVWEAALALELLAQADAPSVRGGVLHLGGEMVQLRPLRLSDSVRCRLELEGTERTERGVVLNLLGQAWTARGQLAWESRTRLLARSGAPGPRREGGSGEPAPEEAWPEVARWKLGSGHGRRYARASGDYNPIHLSAATALPFGFRRPILHGFCAEAFAVHALLAREAGGDPAAVRRVRVSFQRPILLPARLRLVAAGDAEDACRTRFRILDAGDRSCVEGEVVLAPAKRG